MRGSWLLHGWASPWERVRGSLLPPGSHYLIQSQTGPNLTVHGMGFSWPWAGSPGRETLFLSIHLSLFVFDSDFALIYTFVHVAIW